MSTVRFYEAIVALEPATPEEKQKELFSQIRNVIKKFSGNLHHVDVLGSLPLANFGKRKNTRRGLYFHFSYKALPTCVFEVERLFRINDIALFFHHETLDSRKSLDQHQKEFEQILADSSKRESERMARIQLKRKRFQSGDSFPKESASS